jgi:membrane peptidoglycan carboxypeptidase
VPGPYRPDPARARYRSADNGPAGFGGAGRGAGRPGGAGESYRDRPPPRSGGANGSARGSRGADYQPRGGAGGNGASGGSRSAGRPRSDWEQDPRDRARPDARYRGGPGGPGGRPPGSGARPERGSGQVAQDLRDRLGVNGGRNAGRAGGAGYDSRGRGSRTAVGYADDGYGRDTQRIRRGPGGPGDPRGGGRGPGGRGPGGRGGGRNGGPDGTRRGRRSLGEWFRSGDWWRRWTWKKVFALLGAFVLLLVLTGGGLFFYAYSTIKIPNEALAAALSQQSNVYYANGTLIGSFSNSNSGNHLILQQSQIPKVMEQAITAAEDRFFWTEGGISLTGLMRAVYEDTLGSGSTQGGSTLTEQFVKNYYAGFLTAGSTTGTQKLKEIVVAIKLARSKSKQWIMTQYLNTVPFGNQANGLGAAAELYFGKPAMKLTIPQAAMLAAMVNSPGYLNPDPAAGAAYQALVARWQYVLRNMARDGNISQSLYEQLSGCNASGSACPSNPKAFPKVHFHFTSAWSGAKYYIMNMVQQELTSTYGLTANKLDSAGYKITTTIVPRYMRALATAVKENKRLMRAGGKALPWYAHVGATLEQPSTGAILAFYGGPGFYNSTNKQIKQCIRAHCAFNYAEAPAPVGSSFKPYVLATAVQQGMNVQTSILNGYAPLYIPPQKTLADRLELSRRTKPADPYAWTPFTEVAENAGPLKVNVAAAISSDPGFEDLAHRVGDDNIIEMAKALGIGQNPFNADGVNDLTSKYELEGMFASPKLYKGGGSVQGALQIAFGEAPLTTVEQATTFGTLANDGRYSTAHIVAKLAQANGSVVLSKVQHSVALRPSQAADVDWALSFDNSPAIPGATAWSNAAWNRPVVAKTGTLGTGANASEAWFNGAIPQYSLSVNLVTNTQHENIDGLGGISGGLGGTWPAKIWDTFMKAEFNSLPVRQLPTPDYNGYAKWNQVGNLPKKQPKKPNPHHSGPPNPHPSCTPVPFHNCQPGGGSSSPPPTTSTTPPTTSTSPAPTCTPTPVQQCTSSTPSTGVTNGVANEAVSDEARAHKASHGWTLGKALAVLVAGFF